ncbi:MAG: hypothetical protein IT342_04280, partial [Candidatus Melainabacteria bacterium]|nr:hypothetical protein [Candidatus Melainabacteria bacterium]
MAGGDEINQGNNQDAAERKKPPKESAGNSVETSTVAAGSSDFDKSMREEREKTEAAIRAGVATSPIELEYLGVRPVYGPETNLQTRESIEVQEKPLSVQDQKRLQDGRRRFFEPGLDERSRLIALRDSFDALAADRGAANSKGIIREGRNLLGLSNYLTISEALTSVDGGRSQDPQRKELAAKQLTESLKEIKRLSQASPPGESALNLQSLLGGREGMDKLLDGLSSKDSKERDEAMKTLAKAVSGGEGWSADNVLTRAFHEKGQARSPGDTSLRIIGMPRLLDGGLTSLDAENLIVLDPRRAGSRRPGDLSPRGSLDQAPPDPSSNEADQVTPLAFLLAAQLESRRLMQTNGTLDGSGNFQFNFGDRVGRPETLSQRIGSVTPFMLNPQLMLPDPRLMNPRLGHDPLSALLRGNELNPLLGDPLQLRLDGGRSLGGPDSLRFPFGDPLRSARRAEMQAPGWLPAAEAVRDLSSATNSGDALLAIKKLGGLAQVGDQHAQRALAATLLGLTTPPAGMELARRSIASNEPVFTPDLSRLDQGTRDALKKFALSELGGNGMMFVLPEGQGSGKPVLLDMQNLPIDTKRLQLSTGNLPKEALTCLALAIGSGLPSTATESERATMQAMLACQANTDTGAYAIMDALGAHGAQRNDTLEQMLVSGLNGRRGDYFLDSITQGAKTGNDVALGILARALGTEGMEPQKAERCFEALKQAAQNGHGEKVAKILLEQHAKYGDNGGVLNCLGAIAQDGQTPWQLTSKILDVLRKDVASGDPETHQSAIKGFMRLSKFWSSSDLRLIADNVSDTTVQGLRDVVSSANPEAASLLSKRLVENLNAGTYSDVHHQAAAVTALGVLADYAPANSAAVIKEAVTTQRFAGDKDADRLTMAGVHSLMRIGGSRGAASEFALDALREPGFRNSANLKLEQESVRRELADYVTGRITRAEMSAESKAATFDSGFPQSLHSLLRERGVRPADVNSLVERARNNYDDTTIRAVMNRVELYNALPPQIKEKILGTTSSGSSETRPQPGVDVGPPSRAALLTMQRRGGAAETSSADGTNAGQMDVLTVFGQMANGKLETSPNSFLLDPVETKVKEVLDDAARRRRESSEAYQRNEGEIQDRLRDLTTHTSKGVTTWQHFKGWFGDSTLSDFIVVQDQKLQSYNNELGDRSSLTSAIRDVSNEHELYQVALDAMEYRRLRNEGHEGEADRLALSMLKDHGPALATLAPAIWKDLGFARNSSGEVIVGNGDGETVWQRLNRQKAGGSSDAPVLAIGEQGGVAKGIRALTAKHDAQDQDFAARRQLALMSIDTDPNIKPFKETAMELQRTLPDLDKLLRAGLEGTRGPKYVEDLRSKVGSLQRSIDAMNLKDENGVSPLDRTRQSVQELRASLPKLDAESRREVMERIEALEKMIEVFDPESQTGMNIKLLIDKVNSTDFNESGFITWLRGDGIKTIGAVGAAVVAAVAVGSALATFGATSPLAAAAVTV